MNYEKNYFDYINYVKTLDRKKLKKDNSEYIYYEKHHILPKCLGGSDDKENLVLLTAREHYLAHYLLCKFTIDKDRQKMLGAFHMMTFTKEKGYRYSNSRLYNNFKNEYAEINRIASSGENHYNYGKHLTQETKDKIGSSRKGQCAGEESYWYHREISEVTKERRRIGRTGKCKGEKHHLYGKHLPEEIKSKISKSLMGRYRGEDSPSYGRKHSEEERKRMSEIKKAYYKENRSHSLGTHPSEETLNKLRGRKRSKEAIERMKQGHAKSSKNKGINHYNYGKKMKEESKVKMIEKLKTHTGKDHGNYGKVRSEEVRKKYSEAAKERYYKYGASMEGKIRIFSIEQNKHIFILPTEGYELIDLSGIPKLKNNYCDWKNSIGLFMPFNYYGYEDKILIKGYEKKNRILIVELNNRERKLCSACIIENRISTLIQSSFSR